MASTIHQSLLSGWRHGVQRAHRLRRAADVAVVRAQSRVVVAALNTWRDAVRGANADRAKVRKAAARFRRATLGRAW